VPLTESTRVQARTIIGRYPVARSALLPMLHLVQADEGYVSPDGIALCAQELGLTKAEVTAVATFYTMYKRRPTGEHLVSVCTNTLCGLLGGDETYATLSERLGVGHNETTEDGRITLEHAECLAACDFAPVLTVDYEFFDNVTPESAVDLVDRVRSGDLPQPTRGGRLSSFRETERQLAGVAVHREEALADTSIGEPTLAGLQLSADLDEHAPAYPDGRSVGQGEEHHRLGDAWSGIKHALTAQHEQHEQHSHHDGRES